MAARVPASSSGASSASYTGSTMLTDLRADSSEARAMAGLLASESLKSVATTRGASYSLVRVMKIYNAERLDWFGSLDGFANVEGVNIQLAFHGADPHTLTTLCSAGFSAYGDKSRLVFSDSLSLPTEMFPGPLPSEPRGPDEEKTTFTWRALVCLIKPGKTHVFPSESVSYTTSPAGAAAVDPLVASGYTSFLFARERIQRSRDVYFTPYPNRVVPAYLIEYEVTI